MVDIDIGAVIDELLNAEILDEAGPTIRTRSLRNVLGLLDVAYRNGEKAALVVGPAGVGKTTAIKMFVNHHRGWFIRANPSMAMPDLLDAFAKNLSLSRITNRPRIILATVSAKMAELNLPIAIDEAHLLGIEALETVKWIADETNNLLILATQTEHQARIRNKRDVESRIGVVVEAAPLGLDELKTLSIVENFSEHVTEIIHNSTLGILRDIVRIVKFLDAIAAHSHVTRSQISDETAIKAVSKFNLAGARI